MECPGKQKWKERVRIKHGVKFPTTSKIFEGIETEWSLFRAAMISSAIESYGQKRLRMAGVREKKYFGGTKMLKNLSEQKKMLLRPCCKTSHYLICYPEIPRPESCSSDGENVQNNFWEEFSCQLDFNYSLAELSQKSNLWFKLVLCRDWFGI